MLDDRDALYRALRAHDPRFDGRFYVGVTSTGVYCRPVCRVRPPRRDNCRFFPTAAAAEGSGFRPCLRCRPELAPGNAGIDAGARLARAAAELIEGGMLEEAGLDQLAARLGITGRHLRRVFHDELGASPIEYAQTQRLLMAKRLLTDTEMPVIEVAMASGFGSLRRFNTLIKQRYRLTPTDLRRSSPQRPPEAEPVFRVAYRPPFDWPSLITFLGRRAVDGVESVTDAGLYRRTVALESRGTIWRGWLTVRQAAGRHELEVRVSGGLLRVLPQILIRVRRLFDLSCHPDTIAQVLGPLAEAAPGLRVPGAFDGFEMAVRAILGQQITVSAARTVAGRLAHRHGESIETPFPELTTVFPPAQRVAVLDVPAIAELGIIASRARSIIALATALTEGRVRLEPDADVGDTLTALRDIPGIGDWTAQYLAMRALSWPDAFPAGDHGVRKALGEKSTAKLRARAQAWRPWRAYAVMHLWRELETTP